MTKLLLLYLRLFIFIFLYLILIVFIMSYYIQNANNQGEINQGYETYYQCLTYGQPNCSLDDTVTNYNLVMLKGFAISSLGLLLFFLFLSWDVMKFWWELGQSLYYLILRRDKMNAMVVLHKLAFTQSTRTITKGSGTELSITVGEEREMEEEEELSDEEEEEGKESRVDGTTAETSSSSLE